MLWNVITPPTQLPVDIQSLILRMNLDDSPDVRAVLTEMAAEATAEAELKMQCSLMQRTIVAKFYADELDGHQVEVELPRGPVTGITNAMIDGIAIPIQPVTIGHSDRIRFMRPASLTCTSTLVVTYTAGVDSPSKIAADILGAIRQDTATRYAYRENLSDRPASPVRNLDAFYAFRSRVCPIG